METLPGYTRQRFVADLVAGVTVGLVALPLAMAFAISSGVRPEAGIYTAIIAGFIVSALGGSRCQIAGPTGAFVVIVAGIVAKFGVSGLLMCTAMAGGMLLLMGLTGLGSAVRFIPRPVTIGFTNGIAVLIASTQIKDFFGLAIDNVPSEFAPRMIALAKRCRDVEHARGGRLHSDGGHYSAVAARDEKTARHDHRARGDDHRLRLRRSPGRHDRHQIRRHPHGTAARCRCRSFAPT